MQERVLQRLNQAIAERVFSGCAVGISQKGTSFVVAAGTLRYDSAEPVRQDTVYDLASITKSIPTASLALEFIENERLRLVDEVKKYIPGLERDFGATIEDLLRYKVRGPRLSELRYKTFEQVRTHIFEAGFDGKPGESEYTNLPMYLLGVVLERIGGKSLAALGHEYFFGPLHMTHTTFFPAASDCAPTEINAGETLRGVVHDESARMFAKARRSVGHAGLFATAGDLLIFLEALLSGKYPAVLSGAQDGLGWERRTEHFMGRFTSDAAFGKTGFTGTSVIADPEKETILVLLSNRTYPTRPPNSDAINTLRRDIADIVFK